MAEMWLINTKPLNVPDYVVLSHAWGLDEVSFRGGDRDLVEVRQKAGFTKIGKCRKQARSVNLIGCETPAAKNVNQPTMAHKRGWLNGLSLAKTVFDSDGRIRTCASINGSCSCAASSRTLRMVHF